MKTYLADTHSLIWYFVRPDRLEPGAAAAFAEVAAGAAMMYIPVIVLAELVMVIESGRVVADFDSVLRRLQDISNIKIIDLGVERVLDLRGLKQIPDIHDRMIVAEAIAYNSTLITRDQIITASGCVPVIW